ncbi:protein GAMETE EXPRESSED 3 [Salvia miltiorrhiza]|uniref:protein GAMETE EXPRESSED 3 n=1 Tax=Salvia miltiorrhiza TaxID=226208 RepID=UPI0025AD663E|nr:protein GAMETE EXPRESSED 3 [Salvia miltiorrhiza]
MSVKISIISLLISLFPRISSIVVISALIAPLISAVFSHSNHPHKFSPYRHSFSDSNKAGYRLYKSLIMDEGRICACSEKYLFAFERNGSIAWALHLNYTCNANIAPVHGGSSKIYLVAENKVLKIYPLRIRTNEAAVQVFFECAEEIVGISASLSSSCVLINVKNRGLFAYRLHGQLFWSAGPVLYQHGYRQGCRKNVTDCYFTSAPVIDHCEASIFMANTVGEVYSLSIRGHHFKWIQDLSSFGNAFRITAGNNGLLYVTVPDRALVLALDVSRGNVLWQGTIGPLSSADCDPVVDANGWISYSSLDGFLYSFSAAGDLKKFPRSASWSSVMQVNPVLDCSGYAVYISQTEVEEKFSQKIADYTHVSALKPKAVAFTSLVPASGSILWFESDPSTLLLQLSQSDLQHFLVDERTLLTFFAVSRNGNPLPCRTTRQKLASSCAQVKPRSSSIYTGNKRTITLFLMMESIVLLLLAVLVRFCCVFWKKKKLQGLDLGKFLEKRRSLRSQKKAFDKMITELEQRASEEAAAEQEEALQKLGHLVKERESIKRKLSTTYSLGRDGEGSSRPKSLLPLHDGRSRSYSFQGSMKESVTIFHTLSDDESSSDSDEELSSLMEEADDDLSQDEAVGAIAKGKGKALVGGESSSDYETSEEEYMMRPLFLKHSFSEVEEVKREDDDDDGDSHGESRSLRRRTVSFTG